MCKNNGKNVWKVALAAILAAAVSVGLASCSGQKDDDLQAVNDLTSVSQLSVGQHVTFGVYEQDNDTSNGAEPIEWRVLAVEDGRALLITEKLLDSEPYDKTYENFTWETCALRRWLNGIFYNSVFTTEEREKIAAVTNQNPDNPEYGTAGGNDTEDKVFLLSIDEANQYFSSDRDRVAYTTAYAHEHGYDASQYFEEDGVGLDIGQAGTWQLRSPGTEKEYNAFVSWYGEVSNYGESVEYIDMSVRPAVWITL